MQNAPYQRNGGGPPRGGQQNFGGPNAQRNLRGGQNGGGGGYQNAQRNPGGPFGGGGGGPFGGGGRFGQPGGIQQQQNFGQQRIGPGGGGGFQANRGGGVAQSRGGRGGRGERGTGGPNREEQGGPFVRGSRKRRKRKPKCFVMTPYRPVPYHKQPGWKRRSNRRRRKYRRYIGPRYAEVTDYANQKQDLGPLGFDRVSDGCKVPHGYRMCMMLSKKYRERTGLPKYKRALARAEKKGPKAMTKLFLTFNKGWFNGVPGLVDFEDPSGTFRLRDPSLKPKFYGPGMHLEPIRREILKKTTIVKRMKRPKIDPVTGLMREAELVSTSTAVESTTRERPKKDEEQQLKPQMGIPKDSAFARSLEDLCKTLSSLQTSFGH